MNEQQTTGRTGGQGTATGTATDPLAALEADHRRVEQLLGQLADADGEEAEHLVAELREALDLHMELEEDLLYPVVREVVGDEEAQEAEAEHELARTGLDQLEELLGQPGFDAAVEMVKAGIGHHVEEEEGTIFPRLRREGADRLDELAAPMAEARASFEAAMAGSGGGADETDTDDGDDADEDVIDLSDEIAARSGRSGTADARRERAARGRRRRDERASTRGRKGTRRGDLASMSKADLLERAKAADIKGRSSMTKDELVAALGRA